MEGLYPIIRRKRKPLVELAPEVKAPVAPVPPVLSKPENDNTPIQNLPTTPAKGESQP